MKEKLIYLSLNNENELKEFEKKNLSDKDVEHIEENVSKKIFYDVFGNWLIKNKELVFIEGGKIFWHKKNKLKASYVVNLNCEANSPIKYKHIANSTSDKSFLKALSFHSLFKRMEIIAIEEKCLCKVQDEDFILYKITYEIFNDRCEKIDSFFCVAFSKKIYDKLFKDSTFEIFKSERNLFYQIIKKNIKYDLLTLEFDLYKSFPLDCINVFKKGIVNLRNFEFGIIQDIDSEFIHDYRVTLRRLRSLAKLSRDFFNESEFKLLSILKDFQKKTNALRDADVLLSKENYFYEKFPEQKESLNLFFRHLKIYRDEESKKVSEYISSEEYKTCIFELEKMLLQKEKIFNSETSLHATTFQIVRRLLFKQAKKIIKEAKFIIDEGDYNLLHKFRLRLKNFRYTLEFYRKGLKKKKAKKIFAILKNVQDFLGEYQDLNSHQIKLKKISEKLFAGKNLIEPEGFRKELNYFIEKFEEEKKALIQTYQENVLSNVNKSFLKKLRKSFSDKII